MRKKLLNRNIISRNYNNFDDVGHVGDVFGLVDKNSYKK